jgi:hypothetical protein
VGSTWSRLRRTTSKVTLQERAYFARQAYKLALQAAKAAPSPSSWARLLRVAQHLRAAIAEAEREQSLTSTRQ